MCEFQQVQKVNLIGSGKTAAGWFKLEDAQVYHDHFYKAEVEEGVVVDVLNRQATDGTFVHASLELDADSARQLANAILATVDGLQAKRRETAERLAAARKPVL